MPNETVRAERALIKHSMRINGHRTSIALEQEFWDAVSAIAKTRGLTRPKLIDEIDLARSQNPLDPSLASAIRVFVLRHYRGEVAALDTSAPVIDGHDEAAGEDL